MPIKSQVNTIEETIKLVECATLAYTKKDFAVLNKVSNWLFEHIDEDIEEIEDNDPTIIAIVESQKSLFAKSMETKNQKLDKKQGYDLGTFKPTGHMNDIDKLVNNPIFVLLRVLSDESNITVPILKHLSIHMIKFIRFHLQNRNVDLKKFKSNLTNLLESIQPYYKAVLNSLATKLQEEIELIDYNTNYEDVNVESIDLIQFAILDLRLLFPKLLETRES